MVLSDMAKAGNAKPEVALTTYCRPSCHGIVVKQVWSLTDYTASSNFSKRTFLITLVGGTNLYRQIWP
jgi:hypothetical protein